MVENSSLIGGSSCRVLLARGRRGPGATCCGPCLYDFFTRVRQASVLLVPEEYQDGTLLPCRVIRARTGRIEGRNVRSLRVEIKVQGEDGRSPSAIFELPLVSHPASVAKGQRLKPPVVFFEFVALRRPRHDLSLYKRGGWARRALVKLVYYPTRVFRKASCASSGTVSSITSSSSANSTGQPHRLYCRTSRTVQ